MGDEQLSNIRSGGHATWHNRHPCLGSGTEYNPSPHYPSQLFICNIKSVPFCSLSYNCFTPLTKYIFFNSVIFAFLRFNCDGGCWDSGLNQGLMRLWHLAVRRSNHSARSHLILYVSVRVADPDSALTFSADPDPDPAFHFFYTFRIRILIKVMQICDHLPTDVPPGLPKLMNVDINADPDPDPASKNSADPCRSGCATLTLCTAKNQYRKLETDITRKGIARTQSQFPHSFVCQRFIYSHDQSAYSAILLKEIGGPILGIYKSLTDTVNVEN